MSMMNETKHKIEPNEAIVWTVFLDKQVASIAQYEKILNAAELQRANRFYFEKDRQYFIVARATLRMILSRYLSDVSPENIVFNENEWGKPYLKEAEIHFNLSHSGDVALVAITRHQAIGVDVEETTRLVDYIELATRFFAHEEIAQLQSVPPDCHVEVFFNIWTRKEAFIKAIGQGLSYPLTSFAVSAFPDVAPFFLRIDDEAMRQPPWHLTSFMPKDNYIAALATQENIKTLTYLNF